MMNNSLYRKFLQLNEPLIKVSSPDGNSLGRITGRILSIRINEVKIVPKNLAREAFFSALKKLIKRKNKVRT